MMMMIILTSLEIRIVAVMENHVDPFLSKSATKGNDNNNTI